MYCSTNSLTLLLREIKLMAYIGKHENIVEFISAVVENIAQRTCKWDFMVGFVHHSCGQSYNETLTVFAPFHRIL